MHADAGEPRADKLLHMEERLHDRMIGQDEADRRPSATPFAAPAAGLKDPKRPIGSFIFLGSSGVGKTELAKALAGSCSTTRTRWCAWT